MSKPINVILLMFSTLAFSGTAGLAQTVEQPIDISIQPASEEVSPGHSSALVVQFRIPRGFWLGSSDRSARTPSATVIQMAGEPGFVFDRPQFPEPEVRGIPVHLGTTRVYEGKITVVVPFRLSSEVAQGQHTLKAYITYTPGLNAGHLTTHTREAYTTQVTVVNRAGNGGSSVPGPTKAAVPADYLVAEKTLTLPQPMKAMFHTWDENGPLPKALHRLFFDPQNHGKHIQTVWHPFVGSTENNGQTIGGAVALMNVTREGIMTGTFDVRAYHNEYVGNSVAVDIVSCPAAYVNYWFSAQLSEDRNRQVRFHHENLALGSSDRFGYELQVDAFQDPRYRFYGLGAGTNEEDESNYTHEEFGGFLDLTWLPRNHFRVSVGGKIRSVDLKRGAERLAGDLPFTINQAQFSTVPGIGGATVVGERLSLVYDARNQEFTPSAGFFARVTAEYDQVTSAAAPVDNYGRFTLDLRKYFSTVDQRFTLLLRNGWTLTTSKEIPYFDQATLGGETTLRAFDIGRFYGQHAVFASMELRFQAMHMVLMGFPMDLEIAPFLDAGQVFDSSGFDDDFNLNPGMSMRVLNRPNIGIVANGAIGQDGLVFTGGVSLPF